MDGKVHVLCVEAWCRGHVSQSSEWIRKVLGLTKEERNELKCEVEKTALRCSHTIVAAQSFKCLPLAATLSLATKAGVKRDYSGSFFHEIKS